MRTKRYIVDDCKSLGKINIGRVGERGVSKIIFDLSALSDLFGDGTASLILTPPGEASSYPLNLPYESKRLTWVVNQEELLVSGTGRGQIRYYIGDNIAKSVMFEYYVEPSLNGGGTRPTDSVGDWFDELKAYVTQLEQHSISQNELASKIQAYISEHQDDLKGDTGAQGPQGEKGDTGANGSDATVTKNSVVDALGYTPANKTEVDAIKSDLSDLQETVESGGLTDEQMAEIIADYLEENPITDNNTTYSFSISGNTLTITPSTGSATTLTLPTSGGSSVTVDSALSSTSTNPVQNKVVKAELDKKYEKPSSGIPSSDLASGVIPTVSNDFTDTYKSHLETMWTDWSAMDTSLTALEGVI